MKPQTRDAWNALPRWVKWYLTVIYCLFVGLITGTIGRMLEHAIGTLPALAIALGSALAVGVVTGIVTERGRS